MIPLRIKVKGFMSYRDEAELTFDGSGLWMLAGQNGAGKSALFDAISYALYERHRLGGRNHKDLINQQADALLVEYEFALGDDVFCVKRTLSRRGGSSRHVLHIKGPSAPVPGRSGPQSVPETESQTGFDNWVRRAIGLSYETFTASVLLRQGKSDALLEAEPRDRHDMLSQIVDLSRYERLWELADARHKEWRAEASACDRQLQSLTPVDEVRLSELAEHIEQANVAAGKAQEQLRQLAGLKVHSERWNKLVNDRNAVEDELKQSQKLFEHTEQIEREAARLAELTEVVPRLHTFAEERGHLAKAEQRISELTDAVASLQLRLDADAQVQDEKRLIRNGLQAQKQDIERQRDEAQEALGGLVPHMQALHDIDQLREQIEGLNQQLETCAPNLDDRIAQLKTHIDELNELATALPWLRQYVEARTLWRDAQARESDAQAALNQVAQSIPADVLARGISTAAAYAERAQNEATRLSTVLDQEQDRLGQLDNLEGKPTCPYCGQRLTLDHVEAEREHVKEVVRETETELGRAKETYQEAASLKKREDTAQETWRSARRDSEQAASQATNALRSMPRAYRERIEPTEGADLAASFAQDYPVATDLNGLGARAKQLNVRKQELKDADGEARKRDNLLAQHDPAATRLSELGADYPDDLISDIRTQHDAASSQLKATKLDLTAMTQPLRNAESQLTSAEDAYRSTEKSLREARDQQQQEIAQRSVLQRVVGEKRSAIPVKWQPVCDDLTDEHLTVWEAEATMLVGADNRHDKLAEARKQEASRRERLQHIEREQDEIPEEARCLVASLEQQEQDVHQYADEATRGLKAFEDEKRTLETRRAQRTEWTDKQKKAVRQEYLYKELARLLDRDHLQRHLLQQAERGIVANANQVLDRISGGTLRLELRQDEVGNGETMGKASSKALDLVAYNSETGMSPLPVGVLSGSQKFRVSVSLALGIGYWASQGTPRIETVIIDEGFGSLDQQGRRDMIDELHNLKNVLSHVIVVSHQEEFFNAFARGYLIELVDGTSTVKDLETSATKYLAPDVMEPEDANMVVRKSPAAARK